MSTFRYDQKGEDHILRSKNGPTYNHIKDLAEKVHSRARVQVGVDTGDLRASLYVSDSTNPGGMASFVIGSENPIAHLHHEGSRPHLILPKKATLLNFGGYGTIVYAKAVHHPGTRPNRYLTDPLDAVI